MKTVLFLILTVVFPFTYSFAQLEKSIKNGKYGFIDKNGIVVVDYKYDFADDYFNRWGLIEAESNGKKYFIDKSGKEYLLTYKQDEIIPETEAIYLTSKNLSTIPSEVLGCKGLKILILSGNKITELPPEIGTLKKLIVFDISQNNLNIIPPEIKALTELVLFDISGNKLKEIPPEIESLKKLVHLDIFDNPIRHLPKEIGQLNKLEYMSVGSLDSIRLTALPPETGKMTKLSKLNLLYTGIVELPQEINNLPNLKEIALWNDPYLDFTKLCNVLKNNKLNVIISENPEDYFSEHKDTLVVFVPEGSVIFTETFQIKNLAEIQLYNEGYNSRGEDNYYHITKGEIIFLSGKKPVSKDEITAYEKLLNKKEINWQKTGIKEIPEDIAKLTRLELLNLRNNQLTRLPQQINQSKNLKKLNLEGNKISNTEKELIKKWLPECEIEF